MIKAGLIAWRKREETGVYPAPEYPPTFKPPEKWPDIMNSRTELLRNPTVREGLLYEAVAQGVPLRREHSRA